MARQRIAGRRIEVAKAEPQAEACSEDDARRRLMPCLDGCLRRRRAVVLGQRLIRHADSETQDEAWNPVSGRRKHESPEITSSGVRRNRSPPGEIDPVPVDCRAIGTGDCFVVVEGDCVNAVAIKRLP